MKKLARSATACLRAFGRQAPKALTKVKSKKAKDLTKVVIRKLGDDDDVRDYEYWLSRPPEERIAAMEVLRLRWHKIRNERPTRLRRILRVIKSRKS